MKRNTQWIAVATGILLAVLTAVPFFAQVSSKTQKDEVALRAAMEKETVQGDLKGAIEQYQKIVDSTKDRAIAARALIRMAQAYRNLSHAQSFRIYERIVKDYPDQTEAVKLAQAQLAGGEQPAGPVSRTVWAEAQGCCGTVSRDGRFLSYRDREQGDIFIREIATGSGRNLTNRPKDSKDFVYESRISPDGKQVAYLWKTQPDNRYSLRLVNLMGEPSPRVLYDTSALDAYDLYLHDWSPDGKYLAVELHRADTTTKQIALLSVAGGLPVVLRSFDWRGVERIHFSPDGKYLGYDRPQNDTSKEVDVFVLAVDGTSETPAVVHSSNDRMVGWSPDGKWLVFTSDRTGPTELWAVAVVNGKAEGMPQPLRTNIKIGENFRPMGWTSNSGMYYQTSTFGRGSSRVRLASFDWSTSRFSSMEMGTRGYQENTSLPIWSPDGKSLAYLSELRGRENAETPLIVIHAAETGKFRELRPSQLSKIGFMWGWSLDGRSLWVTGNNTTDVQQPLGNGLYKVDSETGASSAVIRYDPQGLSLTMDLTWLPDGLSFLTNGPGTNGVRTTYRVDSKTGNMTP